MDTARRWLLILTLLLPVAVEAADLDSLLEKKEAAEAPEIVPREEAGPAQASPSEPSSTPPARRLIEEIIVTAQKREESLQDVPISLSVLGDDLVHDLGITDFREVSLYVPNVRIDNTSQTDARIRGFGSEVGNIAFEQSVAMVIDGIPYSRLQYWQGPLFDIDRVEVLRGPQGTLFGKNTTVGLFNVTTKKPTPELTGYANLALGELGRRLFEGAVGGAVIEDVIELRVSGLLDERDGLLRNTTARSRPGIAGRMNERDRKAVRVQVGFPNVLGADFVIGYEHVETEGFSGTELRVVKDTHVPFFQYWDPEVDLVPGNGVGSIDLPNINRNDLDTMVANAGYELLGWDVRAAAGYSLLRFFSAGDNDMTPAPMVNVAPNKDDNPQTTLELRTHSPSLGGLFGLEELAGWPLGSSDVTVGFFFQRREIVDNQISAQIHAPVLAQFAATDATGVVPPCPGCDDPDLIEESTTYFDETADAIAGFFQMDWAFLDPWNLQFGTRWTHEKKTARWQRAFTRGTGAAWTALGQEEFTATRSRSELAFTPKVALSWAWSEDWNLYASWSKGFKGGGFNQPVSNDDVEENFGFDPEKVTDYEIGTKLRLLGGAATANLALFRLDMRDLQVFTVNPDFTFAVVNAGRARAQGVEADLAWLPADWLTLRGALGFNDARFLDYPFGFCPFDMEDTDGDGDPACDFSGRRLWRTPRWTGTLAALVRTPLASLPLAPSAPFAAAGLELVGALTGEVQSDYFAYQSLDPRGRQPDFFRLGGSLGLSSPEQGWSVRLVGENLTDVTVASFARDLSLVGGSLGQVTDPPRLFYGELRYEF